MLNDSIICDLLLEIVEDEENLNIIQCLIDGISTDEEIAEKTGIRLNIVRKVLYKLYDEGLASYRRDKDKYIKNIILYHLRMIHWNIAY